MSDGQTIYNDNLVSNEPPPAAAAELKDNVNIANGDDEEDLPEIAGQVSLKAHYAWEILSGRKKIENRTTGPGEDRFNKWLLLHISTCDVSGYGTEDEEIIAERNYAAWSQAIMGMMTFMFIHSAKPKLCRFNRVYAC